MRDELKRLADLGPNWDGYKAPPLDTSTIERAQAFLDNMSTVPLSNGGVQFEWHMRGLDLEISFEPDGKTYVLTVSESGK